MKHFMLKFNYGVEVGARLAYLGHYRRTKDEVVWEIVLDEVQHSKDVKEILHYYGEKPNRMITTVFAVVGWTIYYLCQISPEFLLNYVARTMETFAMFSYGYLAVRYPDFRYTFLRMADAEKTHEAYFSGYSDPREIGKLREVAKL